MQQFDVPIIHKTYELYRELHDLQKTIPKVERFTLKKDLMKSGVCLAVGLKAPEQNKEKCDLHRQMKMQKKGR